MASDNKPDPNVEKTKKRIRKDIQQVEDSADIISGVKTPDSKVFKDAKKKKKDITPKVDIDDYLKTVEAGFTDLTPEKNDKPYNGNLGKVKIRRLTGGTGVEK